MKLKKAFFALFLLYTIFFNNSIQIFAQSEISTELMDMSAEEYVPDNITPAHLDENGKPVIVAKSAVVMDADTGIVVYGKNENDIHYPASITKVLTALIACEETSPDDLVTFSEEAVYGIGEDSSSIAVRVGETLNMDQCLNAIMLASANDVCVGVSEFISGSQAAFVEKMNEKAKSLGAVNSHFANSHGYHDENHYTTAYDMALILREAVKNPVFMKAFGNLTYDIPKTNVVDEERHLFHRAKILWKESPYYYQYIKGSKTGFTDQAGNTLISYAEKDGVKLICCVLADRGINTYTDTSLLFDYGFNSYSQKTLVEGGELSLVFPVYQEYNGRTIDLGLVTAEVKDSFSAYLPAVVDKNTITVDYDVPESIMGGVKEGDIVGSADILYSGSSIASLDVVANSTIDPIPEAVLSRQEKLDMLVKIALRLAAVLFVLLIIIVVYQMITGNKMYRHKKKYKQQRKYYRSKRRLKIETEEEQTEDQL